MFAVTIPMFVSGLSVLYTMKLSLAKIHFHFDIGTSLFYPTS